MKEWCDTLLSYQVRTNRKYTDGALLCPTCHVVHGRIADLCFPLTVIWAKTGEDRYLEEADLLIDWTEYNLRSTDGLWYNDAGNRWYGTSAFAAMSIAEAIYNFGDILPAKYKDKWMGIFLRMVETIMTLDTRESFRPVSNYYCGMGAVLGFAYALTGEMRYLEKSGWWMDVVISRLDKDLLLFGEGYPMEADDGSHTIDMGYSLEESLPLLLRYSSLTGKHGELFKKSLYSHLEFLLPDGAIDNSFGSRHNKWTYWGSRTSDGAIEGLSLLLNDPVIADATERVLSLYEKCTHDGLLAMPMAHEAGEPTCLHHTFAHAKALASLVTAKHDPVLRKTTLPSEIEYGVKQFQNGRLLLVSKGGFRATFSAVRAMLLPDYAANGGGSMNLLYHRKRGIICAATSAEYHPSEPLNQQYQRNADNPPSMTAQFVINGRQASKDKTVELSYTATRVTAKAEKWQAEYAFEENRLIINLTSEDGIYNLPIVASKEDPVTISEDQRTLTVADKITVTSTAPLNCNPTSRIFHQVGGLLYLPVSVSVKGSVTLTFTVG